MYHIPAHKNTKHPPGQQPIKETPPPEVREQPPKPYHPPKNK